MLCTVKQPSWATNNGLSTMLHEQLLLYSARECYDQSFMNVFLAACILMSTE